jgi:hypothetical protein
MLFGVICWVFLVGVWGLWVLFGLAGLGLFFDVSVVYGFYFVFADVYCA